MSDTDPERLVWHKRLWELGHLPRMETDIYGTPEEPAIDMWAMENGYHNGPFCRLCLKSWCIHCVTPESVKPCTWQHLETAPYDDTLKWVAFENGGGITKSIMDMDHDSGSEWWRARGALRWKEPTEEELAGYHLWMAKSEEIVRAMPTPWEVRHDDEVWSADNFNVCACNTPEDAALIVRAVNWHVANHPKGYPG
jgi:hypothetical protein